MQTLISWNSITRRRVDNEGRVQAHNVKMLTNCQQRGGGAGLSKFFFEKILTAYAYLRVLWAIVISYLWVSVSRQWFRG